MRGPEILPIAAKMDGIGFAALEAFGGATFETWLREGDNPWDFLRKLAKATPKTPIQALIRGQNLVGHRNYADDAVELFVEHAARCGVDVFRVFDPLNDLRNMEVAIRTAKRAKRRRQRGGRGHARPRPRPARRGDQPARRRERRRRPGRGRLRHRSRPGEAGRYQ